MTLGSAAKAGLRLIVWCRGCQHQVEPDPAQLAERYGVETRVLDWHTTKITLGTGVCLIPEHNPLLLAKQVATLDNFSRGRFIFGVGAGWLREETQIMGGDYDHRWGQTREAILAMKELWAKDEAEFHGKYYDFPPVISFPKPLQQPHPPIYVGAMTAGNVFRRVVTYGNGWMLWLYTPEQIRDGRAMLDKVAREFGRNPRSIVVVAAPVAAEPDVIK